MNRIIFLLVMFVLVVVGYPLQAAEVEEPRVLRPWPEKTAGLEQAAGQDASALDRLFALPPDFYNALDNASNTTPRPWLGIGIREVAPVDIDAVKTPVLEISRVYPHSPAEAKGLRVGDRITHLQGDTFTRPADEPVVIQFLKRIAKVGEGNTAKIDLIRDGKALSFEVVLVSRPRVVSKINSHPEWPSSEQATPSLFHHALKEAKGLDDFKRLLNQMRRRTDEAVTTAVKGETYNPFRLPEVSSLLYRPFNLPKAGQSMVERLHAGFDNQTPRLDKLITTSAEALDTPLEKTKAIYSKPQNMTEYLDRLIKTLTHAQVQYRNVIGNLKPNEIDLLERWFVELVQSLTDEEPSPEEEKESERMTLDLFRIALKVDMKGLLELAHTIAEALDVPLLQQLAAQTSDLPHFPEGWSFKKENGLTIANTPAGLVLIGDESNNVYVDDAVLILDLGGNDIYRNRAGGARPGVPFSIVIDLAGDDQYLSSSPFSQGSAFLGAGFLIDLQGDDLYSSKNLSQGNAVVGVGALVDLSGRDRYLCRAFCQASSAWGVGLITDASGNDAFDASIYAQGFGFVKGFGALLDRAGNDQYQAGGLVADHREPDKATKSMAQGFGLGMNPWSSLAGASGGIGVLSDRTGNDTYTADYFAQGASYWFALGILNDGGGHDRYIAGRYAQGTGVHYSLGLLMDKEGDDFYQTHFGVSQGCGHDFSAGFLLDHGGDDRYVSGVMAQGAGNANGIGVLNDNGGTDEYFVRSEGQGRGHYAPLRDLKSIGLLLDTGGAVDRYVGGGANDTLRLKGQLGFQVDVD